MWYEQLIKPILFRFPPEKAHRLSMAALDLAAGIPGVPGMLSGYREDAQDHFELAGLRFKNRLGLAAGFDKDGKHLEALASLGFGFIEMGTITPRPQPGNPQPRLFRLKKDRALINRMGFNNDGVERAVSRLSRLRERDYVLGANIGKNKLTPNEDAVHDYVFATKKLHNWVDYFAVNVSSPNTPGLRALQEKEPLRRILTGILEVLADAPVQRPVFLKIAPDLSDAQLEDTAQLVNEIGIAGIIASNTTLDRSALKAPAETLAAIGDGGLSGPPVKPRSTEIVRLLRAGLSPGKALIAVGGIESGEDALEKIRAGADLVQIYTGFIYRGPGLIGEITDSLREARP